MAKPTFVLNGTLGETHIKQPAILVDTVAAAGKSSPRQFRHNATCKNGWLI
jgi:hypothetical protein